MSIRRPVLLVGVVAALAAAGCGEELSSSPGTPPPTIAAPETTAATSTTTSTTAAPTTAAPTSAPATTTASTTTTLPSAPAAVTVRVLAGGGDAGWLDLGAWQRTRWDRSDGGGEPTGITVETGTTWTISNVGGQRPGTVDGAAESCFDGRSGPTLTPTVTAPNPPGFGYSSIAVLPPAWPLKPRPVIQTRAAVAGYEALGEAAFEGAPVDASLADIEQLVIADLDGDGDDEALTVFEHVPTPGIIGAPGDLSALLLVDTGTRSATTVVRSLVAADAGDPSFVVLDRFRVIDVSDLNGDGRMEVVVHAWYYEGAAVLVYEYDGTGLVEVLASGCGA